MWTNDAIWGQQKHTGLASHWTITETVLTTWTLQKMFPTGHQGISNCLPGEIKGLSSVIDNVNLRNLNFPGVLPPPSPLDPHIKNVHLIKLLNWFVEN